MNFITQRKRQPAAPVAGCLLFGAASAAEQGTAAEAKAMVKKAVAHMMAAGPDRACDAFTNGKGFKDRDLDTIVDDLNGKNLAQGANPTLVGKDLIGLKDPDGKPMYLARVGDTLVGSGISKSLHPCCC